MSLFNLEIKLVTLIAEVLGFSVLQVAIRAVERILIVRRHVRIGGFDVLRFFHQRFGVVAPRASLKRGDLRIFHVHIFAVATFTREPSVRI